MPKKMKKIGKSVLGTKPARYRRPTPEEMEELKEQLRQQREQEKAQKLEEEGKKLPKTGVPGEIVEPPEHKPKPISLSEIDEAIEREKREREKAEVEIKEVPDRRLKKKKKLVLTLRN